MAKISAKSRSFLRNRRDAIFIGDFEKIIKLYQINKKTDLLEYMKRHHLDDRAVFFAENLRIKTRKEIETLKKDLYERLKAIGTNGIVELHLSGDNTSKDAHIHYWGVFNDLVKNIIESWIRDNKLTNKIALEYTNENFDKKIFEIINDSIYEINFKKIRNKIKKIKKRISTTENFETKEASKNNNFSAKINLENYLKELDDFISKNQ